MKISIKRFLSLMCVMAMLVFSLMAAMPAEQVKADESDSLQQMTFRDLGFDSGVYSGDVVYSNWYEKGLDNVAISGTLKFTEGTSSWILFGDDSFTRGFKLCQNEGNLVLQNVGGDFFYYAFEEAIAGVPVIGDYVDIKLTLQKVDNDADGNKDDLKVGVYFANKLYNNAYIYIDNYAFIDLLVQRVVLVPQNHSIEIKGNEPIETMPEGLTEVTFRDFGLADGKYTGNYVQGVYEAGFDGTRISGKVKFPNGTRSWILFGNGDWQGFKLCQNEGNLVLQNVGGNFFYYAFEEEVAGVPTIGEYVDLDLTIQLVDHDNDGSKDDLKVGAWFAGKLYNNKYIYIDNFPFAQKFPDNVFVIPQEYNHFVEVYSTGNEVPDDGVTEDEVPGIEDTEQEDEPTGPIEPDEWKSLTYTDLNLQNGHYSGDPAGGSYKTGLNKKELSGKIALTGNAQIMIGHPVEWQGLWLYYNGSGELILQNIGGNYNFVTGFDEKVAGVSLKQGTEMDIKFSFELLDNDGDGKEDDLKLGVFFANKLYGDTYFYLDNYPYIKHGMQNQILIIPNGGTIDLTSFDRGPEIIPFEELGLTLESWEDFVFADSVSPDTGDHTMYSIWLLPAVIALIIASVFAYKVRK